MNKYFARLSPLERRFMVGLIVVVFLVLNFMFVQPHLGDWGKVKQRLERARSSQALYDAEIAKRPTYESGLKAFEQEGTSVPQENQDIDFLRNVQTQSAQSHVTVLSNTRQQGVRTNQFFVERVQVITAQSNEKELVDFLYNLGSASSMIRVRDLSIRPTMARLQLATTIKLVASYQKQSATPAPNNASTAKPATPKGK